MSCSPAARKPSPCLPAFRFSPFPKKLSLDRSSESCELVKATGEASAQGKPVVFRIRARKPKKRSHICCAVWTTCCDDVPAGYSRMHRQHLVGAVAQDRAEERRAGFPEARKRK